MNISQIDEIAKQAALFTERCEAQIREQKAQREAQEKKEREDKEQRDRIKKRFEDTILRDLQLIFKEISPLLSSPYLDVLLDTHIQRRAFVINDNDATPAYAFFAIDAKSGESDETFATTRYLLFRTNTASENSFNITVNNNERDVVSKGGNEGDSSIPLKSYSFDSYDLDEIRSTVENYLLEELDYHKEHFCVEEQLVAC